MPVNDVESAEVSVRQWILKKFGTQGENVYFESVRRETTTWSVDVQFNIGGYRKYYTVSVDSDTGSVTGYNEKFRPFSFPPYIPPSKGTSSMLLLGALIVSIIVVIIFISQGLTNLVSGMFGLYSSSVLGGVGRIVMGIFLLAFGIIDIYLTVEINSIREMFDRGDIKSAAASNTLALGVVSLIFDGIVPGILLIVAREEMSRLDVKRAA